MACPPAHRRITQDFRRIQHLPQVRAAMSMLMFYINRAGKNLDKEQLAVLEQAKIELRRLKGKE